MPRDRLDEGHQLPACGFELVVIAHFVQVTALWHLQVDGTLDPALDFLSALPPAFRQPLPQHVGVRSDVNDGHPWVQAGCFRQVGPGAIEKHPSPVHLVCQVHQLLAAYAVAQLVGLPMHGEALRLHDV